MKKIYFAAPLFTMAEKEFNRRLSTAIAAKMKGKISFILPQEFSVPKDDQFFQSLFQKCIHAIEESDIILAILDGPDSDSGTCVEIGYAYAKNKPVIGIRTDIRISEDRGLNLMVSQLCTQLIFGLDRNMEYLSDQVVNHINQLQK
jgi:nucleoside 2-deoxyribosyltransferase